MADVNKKKVIGYWVLTGMIILGQGASGVMELLALGPAVESIVALGYPAYLLYILGPAKIAGVIVLALPKLPRLKEWAYAGFAIDFIGAFASHALNGDGIDLMMPPVVFTAILFGSYFLRPANRRLA